MNQEWTVERHLLGKPPEVVALYHRFIELAQACGPFTYAVSKSAITLKGTRRGFAGASLGKQALSGYLDLPRRVQDPRITRSSPYTKRLWVHHFRIDSLSHLDQHFAGWLGEAYRVGGGAHLDPPVKTRPDLSAALCRLHSGAATRQSVSVNQPTCIERSNWLWPRSTPNVVVITEARPQPFTWPFGALTRSYPLTCAYAPLRYSGAIVRCTSDVPPRASCYRVRICHTFHA